MFKISMSEQFRKSLEKITKKDPKLAIAINRKIKEIISRDSDSIHYYKNLTKEMKAFKRVHIRESFVMLFEVDIEKAIIFFSKIGHRDNIYKP